MLNLKCPICKNHCDLIVDEDTRKVSGNKCARGVAFGEGELDSQNANSVLTYKAKTSFAQVPTVDVKTSDTVPKEMFFHLIRLIRREKITQPLKRGEVLLHHPLELPVDIIIDSDELENLN